MYAGIICLKAYRKWGPCNSTHACSTLYIAIHANTIALSPADDIIISI